MLRICQSRTNQPHRAKLCQRACKANARQNWFKNIPTFQKKINNKRTETTPATQHR